MDHDDVSPAALSLLHGFNEVDLAEMLAAAQAELMKPGRCPQCPHCADSRTS